jgi:hypothetical protein
MAWNKEQYVEWREGSTLQQIATHTRKGETPSASVCRQEEEEQEEEEED